MLAAAPKADDIAFMRLDQRFNILIATAARNEFARRSMGLMNALSRRFWSSTIRKSRIYHSPPSCTPRSRRRFRRRGRRQLAIASDRLIDYIENFARKT